jgi:SAM-dependent methyltransferase
MSEVNQPERSIYYQHSGKVPIASRLSYIARRRIFQLFMDVMQPDSSDCVLDIGVTSDITYAESNFFEQFYPYKCQMTCVGTEEGFHLEKQYPGLKFIQVKPEEPLPFSDYQFDIVFSNAVIEHVGNTTQQTRFLAEAMRVGKHAFITTPNRWFPVEHHTGVPLLHYLPKSFYRQILRRTALRYWAYEQHLNLLTKRQFVRLVKPYKPLIVQHTGIGYGIFCSNLVAYAPKGL